MKKVLICIAVFLVLLSGCSQEANKPVNNPNGSKANVEQKVSTDKSSNTSTTSETKMPNKVQISAKANNEDKKAVPTPSTSPNKAGEDTKKIDSKATNTIPKIASESVSSNKKISAKKDAAPKPSIESSVSVTKTAKPSPAVNMVYLSIQGIDDQTNILGKTEVEFKEGESVFDVLLRETRARKIQMEFSGSKNAAYIKGIDNLYEFDKGESSGWLYSVNGNFPKISCGSYKLKKGDRIEWKYTKDSAGKVK